LVSALIVNPITYALLGYDLKDLPLGNLLQDGLYFVLLYLIWSLLYLQLSGRSLVETRQKTLVDDPVVQETISVTKGNRVFKLDPANISCIKASGDYVELCTDNASYLKQGTIGFYEEALNPLSFVRIHRSIIVNRNKVVSVASAGKGQFWITLDDGQELRSSRRYMAVVESLTPEAL
jgi:DNA-binding LytR/AlgR family response regulator